MRSSRSSRAWHRSPPLHTPPSPYSLDKSWDMPLLVSSRGLDMCLLAVCSCALSLLCHQTSGLLNMPSISVSATTTPSSSAPAQVDFMVKAGLVTNRDKTAEPEEDA